MPELFVNERIYQLAKYCTRSKNMCSQHFKGVKYQQAGFSSADGVRGSMCYFNSMGSMSSWTLSLSNQGSSCFQR